MTILGTSFLLALGGLFLLDVMTYWITIAAMTGIAFVAAYLAEKRMNLVEVNGEKTEIVLSFNDESPADPAAAKIDEENSIEDEQVILLEDIPAPEVLETIEEPHNAALEEIVLIEAIPIEEELTNQKVQTENFDEEIEEKPEQISKNEQDSEIVRTEANIPLEEITDEEFSFLVDGREIIEEELQEQPEAAEDKDEEVLMQRALWLDELEGQDEEIVLENTIATEEAKQDDTELVDLETDAEPALMDFINDEALIEEDEMTASDLKEDLAELSLEDIQDIQQGFETETEPAEEDLEVNDEEFTHQPNSLDDEIQPVENVEIDPEETGDNPISVSFIEELEEVIEPHSNFVVEKLNDVEVDFYEEQSPVVHDDMEFAVQDMLLNTLEHYQNQGDDESYTAMLESLLHQNLSDKDYYIFSKLLVDYYISSGDNDDFYHLLEKMKEKLHDYPLVIEEINQYLSLRI
jgi:hypothetical protein